MCHLFLVRPGQTDFDDQNRIKGSLNLPLNEDGVHEVDQLIESLAGLKLDLILSGPNDPSHSTAELLSDRLDIPLKVIEGFRNVDQGLWEGLELGEVKRKYPSIYKHWEDAPAEVSIPNAESTESVLKRLEKPLRKYMKKDANTLIVAAEPLASLVACLVEGRKICVSGQSKTIPRCQIQELKPVPAH